MNRHGHRQRRHLRERDRSDSTVIAHIDSGTYSRKDSSVPVEEAGLSPKGHDDITACVEVVACNCHLGATRHWSPFWLEIREGQSL